MTSGFGYISDHGRKNGKLIAGIKVIHICDILKTSSGMTVSKTMLFQHDL